MPTIDEKWEALKPDKGQDVFQLFDPTHPLGWYAGRDPASRRLLLLVTAEEPPSPRELRAMRLEAFKRDDGRWSLLFRLSDSDLSPVFSLLSADLIESSRRTSNQKGALAFVMKRFASWQRLLERGALGLLEDSEVRGLCGELLILEHFLRGIRTPMECVSIWMGPLEADQDFQTAERAWEIKAIRPDSVCVNIASENQLYSTRRLELVTVTLNDHDAPTGETFTLNSLVNRIRNTLHSDVDAGDLFDEKMRLVRYVPHSEYDKHHYSFGGHSRFDVRSGFPRLVAAMIPAGVSRVRYELSLNQCHPFQIQGGPPIGAD